MPFSAKAQTTLTRDEVPTDDLVMGLKALLSIGFDAHNDRLRTCVAAGVDLVERHTGLLLYPGTVAVRYAQLYDYEELPWGPVTGTVAATGLLGESLNAVLTTGNFPEVFGSYPAGIALTYEAGYELGLWPAMLKEAVLLCSAEQFDGMERPWKRKASPYCRSTWAS